MAVAQPSTSEMARTTSNNQDYHTKVKPDLDPAEKYPFHNNLRGHPHSKLYNSH
jgi:hypothetical protein